MDKISYRNLNDLENVQTQIKSREILNFVISVPKIYSNLLLDLEILSCLSTVQHCRHGVCVSREMETHPVDGEWGPWGPYSSCSRTCGGGIKSTTRLCNRPEYVFCVLH